MNISSICNIITEVSSRRDISFANSPYYHLFQLSRKPVYAKRGMVAASNPLAAEAGLEILKQGGNAVDAAIAVSGALTDSDADSSGTVYFAVADGERNMVSYIQSNYMGFGSGLVVPGAGISLQNRGHTFSLDPARANCLKPGKKTYHTIIPGFLTKGGQAVGPFVAMGGFMQPQGHLQFITNSIDYNMNPQAALDVPRWQWIKGKTVKVEQNFPDFLVSGLARRGHNVQVENSPVSFGRGQSIWRYPETGVLVGATESRADGTVAAW